MNYTRLIKVLLAVALGSVGTQACARNNLVTLIEMGDLHRQAFCMSST